MANFREYSVRLQSIGNMHRVTGTMKMVSASHLHRAQNELKMPEPFAAALRALWPAVKTLPFTTHRVCAAPPLRASRVLMVVLTANRGLCGSFNYAIVREIRQWLNAERTVREIVPAAIYVGQKGWQLLKAELPALDAPTTLPSKPKASDTAAISRRVIESFLSKEHDEVWIAGNRFKSANQVEPQIRRLLPLDPQRIAQALTQPDSEELETILEPQDDRLIDALTRQWVHLDIYTALLNSVAGEHASRVIAMENATSNLSRISKELTLLRNRARQAAITNELTEIISGAESLE